MITILKNDKEFMEFFNHLVVQPYEAHWFNRVPVKDVLDGLPSDCSDRSYALAWYCEQKDIPYRFVVSLLTGNGLSLHMALFIEGLVYDPTWNKPGMSLEEYKGLIKGYCLVVGEWVRLLIP